MNTFASLIRLITLRLKGYYPYGLKVINLIGNDIYMHRPRNNILLLEI